MHGRREEKADHDDTKVTQGDFGHCLVGLKLVAYGLRHISWRGLAREAELPSARPPGKEQVKGRSSGRVLARRPVRFMTSPDEAQQGIKEWSLP